MLHCVLESSIHVEDTFTDREVHLSISQLYTHH